MTCQYLNAGKCVLGYYGGEPQAVHCKICIRQNLNTSAARDELFASREKTHPSTIPRISGCCDPPPPPDEP